MRSLAVTFLQLACAAAVAWFGWMTGGRIAAFAGYEELGFLVSLCLLFAALSGLERLLERLKTKPH